MKKMMFTMLLLCSFGTNADGVWLTSKVKTIYPLSSGDFIVLFVENSPQCSHSGGYHYVQNGNNGVNERGVDKLYSGFLSAAAASKTVQVWFEGSSPTCNINRVKINF